MQSLPKQFKLFDCAYTLDGGSIKLYLIDENKNSHIIKLVQRMFPKIHDDFSEIPGRLYFNDNLIPIRSEIENQLIELLKTATINYKSQRIVNEDKIPENALIGSDDIKDFLTRTPTDNLTSLRNDIVNFVESAKYLLFADEVEQINKTKKLS